MINMYKWVLTLTLLLTPFILQAKVVAESKGEGGTAYLTDEACPFSSNQELAYAYGINKVSGKKDLEACWVIHEDLVVFLVPNQDPVGFPMKAFTWKETKL
jgi:hypothetical protein